MSYVHEQDKIKNRFPAALDYIRKHKLNETFGPSGGKVGIIVQGGMYNGTIRALERLGLADIYGESRIPIHVLNVTYPLVSDELLAFSEGKEHLLVIEEGQPEFIEQALGSILYRAESRVKLHGKGAFPMAGEYTGTVMMTGVEAFLKAAAPDMLPTAVRAPNVDRPAIPDLSKTVPIRPPGFCTGCPERPIFAAMKLVEKKLGKHQIAAEARPAPQAQGPACLVAGWQALADRAAKLPAPVAELALPGLRKVVEFQDLSYGGEYLALVEGFLARDRAEKGFALSAQAAKYIANAMAYDDVIRVAGEKSKAPRFARIAQEMGVSPDKVLQ